MLFVGEKARVFDSYRGLPAKGTQQAELGGSVVYVVFVVDVDQSDDVAPGFDRDGETGTDDGVRIGDRERFLLVINQGLSGLHSDPRRPFAYRYALFVLFGLQAFDGFDLEVVALFEHQYTSFGIEDGPYVIGPG